MPYRKLLHELYQNLPQDLHDYLFDGHVKKEFSKEAIICRQGEPMVDFFKVESGIVRALYSNGSKTITTEFYFPGEMITCFLPAFTGEQLLQSIQSITPTEIIACPLHSFKDRLLKNELCRVFFDKIVAVFMLEQQQRSQIFRTSSAIERYEHLLHNYPEYLEIIPLKYLASFVDMKRETMSRMRKKMKTIKGFRAKSNKTAYV